MSIDVEELGLEVVRNFNRMIDDFQIPAEVFSECGLSAFSILLLKNGGEAYKERLKQAEMDFEKLCKSTFAPVDAVQALSLGYAALAFMARDNDYSDVEDSIKTILAAQFSYGTAHGILVATSKAMVQRTELLSEAGKSGADSRNKNFEALKAWAITKASGMHGADRDIARSLSGQIPKHLANKSKDPMRLIYDALRAKPRAAI